MNLFDFAAGLVLLVSALVGFSRGAVLEVVGLFAFTIAAAASVYLLPFTSPVAHAYVHTTWAANAAAVVTAFLIIYIALRILGSSISRGLRSQAALNSIDRAIGLGFGVARALVVLGVVYLVFSATPLVRPPALVADAKLYPLCRLAGQILASLAPGGLSELSGLGHMLQDRAASDPANGQADSPAPDAEPPQPQTLQVTTSEPPHRHHHHPRPAEPVE